MIDPSDEMVNELNKNLKEEREGITITPEPTDKVGKDPRDEEQTIPGQTVVVSPKLAKRLREIHESGKDLSGHEIEHVIVDEAKEMSEDELTKAYGSIIHPKVEKKPQSPVQGALKSITNIVDLDLTEDQKAKLSVRANICCRWSTIHTLATLKLHDKETNEQVVLRLVELYRELKLTPANAARLAKLGHVEGLNWVKE